MGVLCAQSSTTPFPKCFVPIWRCLGNTGSSTATRLFSEDDRNRFDSRYAKPRPKRPFGNAICKTPFKRKLITRFHPIKMIDGLLSRQVTSQNKTKSQRIFFCMHPAFQICNFSLNYLIFSWILSCYFKCDRARTVCSLKFSFWEINSQTTPDEILVEVFISQNTIHTTKKKTK